MYKFSSFSSYEVFQYNLTTQVPTHTHTDSGTSTVLEGKTAVGTGVDFAVSCETQQAIIRGFGGHDWSHSDV